MLLLLPPFPNPPLPVSFFSLSQIFPSPFLALSSFPLPCPSFLLPPSQCTTITQTYGCRPSRRCQRRSTSVAGSHFEVLRALAHFHSSSSSSPSSSTLLGRQSLCPQSVQLLSPRLTLLRRLTVSERTPRDSKVHCIQPCNVPDSVTPRRGTTIALTSLN